MITFNQSKPLDQAASDRSVRRIKQLLSEGMLHADVVKTLNEEGYTTIRGCPWTALNLRQVLWKLRWQRASWYALSAKRAGLAVGIGIAAC
jgi:hypothetical protein